MDINKEAVESLLKAIDDIVGRRLGALGHDVTKAGIVQRAAPAGKYFVRIDGAEHCVASAFGGGLAAGDLALVLFLQGNFSDGYIIGKV